MELRARRIKSLHRALSARAHETLGKTVGIDTPKEVVKWEGLVPQSEDLAVFEFRTLDQQTITDVAQREWGQKCLVVPVAQHPQGDDRLWAAWYEEWKALGRSRFRLRAASWTFFLGPMAANARPVLRADWDDPGAEDAGQPHWHVHHVPPPDQRIGGSAAEGGDGAGTLSARLGGLHLSMCVGLDSDSLPGCIQPPLNQQQFLRWFSTTLWHVRMEVTRRLFGT